MEKVLNIVTTVFSSIAIITSASIFGFEINDIVHIHDTIQNTLASTGTEQFLQSIDLSSAAIATMFYLMKSGKK